MRPGVSFSIGKPKPVTLVSTVVARNTAVQPSSRCDASMPLMTTKPVTIPTMLMITCTQVNAEKSRFMVVSSAACNAAIFSTALVRWRPCSGASERRHTPPACRPACVLLSVDLLSVELSFPTPHVWRAARRRSEAMTAMRIRLAAGCIAIALAGPAQMIPAQAADQYPTRPVRIIVPFDPGGINETGARIVATPLSERLGKQFIIEFKPGAGGMVGTELASRAARDGYTNAGSSVAHAGHPALCNLTYVLRK